MATDKLINSTQGDDIIGALNDIADNVGNITYGPQTSADKVVSMLGYAEAAEAASINPGDTLNVAIGKLEKKANDNATEIENKIDKLTNATAGDIATVTATGEIADSAVSIADSNTGLADSDTAVPTSKTVKTYVDSTATGISRYLGTITAASGLSTSAKKGDFYVVKTAWSGVHAGDEIIAEKDNPAQTIDGTNWSLLHNEADTDTKYTFATGDSNGTFKVTPSDTGTAQSVPIKGLGNAAYKGVATSVSTSEDLVTSKAVNTKLGDYVQNSDLIGIVDNGVKNIIDWTNPNTAYQEGTGIVYTNNSDGTWTVAGTKGSTTNCRNIMVCIQGNPITEQMDSNTDYVIQYNSSGTGNCHIDIYGMTDTYNKLSLNSVGNNGFAFNSGNYTDWLMRLIVDGNAGATINFNLTIMLTTKSQYNISPIYEPYALGNQYLTPELIELCDSGAKNLLDLSKCTFTGLSNSYTVSGNTITIISYTTSSGIAELSLTTSQLPTNTNIVLTGCPSGGGDTTYLVDAYDNGTYINGSTDTGSGSSVFKFTTTTQKIRIRLAANYTITNKSFNLMVCTKAAFGVSSKFVPYRPNWDLVAMSVWTVKEQAFTNTTANTYQYTGVSVTVPAYQMYEIIAIDRVGTARPLGIIISDNNTDITTVSAIIAENEDISTTAMPWTKQLHCMTPSIKTVEHTFYVWVKRETTGSNAIVLAYRRIV